MSETQYLFERAKRAATKAIQAERSGDLNTAFEQFLKAAEILQQLMELEKTPKIRDSYYDKAKLYISRAKEIKALQHKPKISSVDDDLPSVPDDDDEFPSPPKPKPKTLPPSPPPRDTPPSPPPPKDITGKMMRGEDDEDEKDDSPKDTLPIPPPPQDKPKSTNLPPPPKPKETPPPPPKKEINLPSKTTFELLFDEGKYRDCVDECAKSVEAELRVRLGLFDEQLTLGMIIEQGLKKGMDVLREFKYVNILMNRIEHENYRPNKMEAQKAVDITNKILLS